MGLWSAWIRSGLAIKRWQSLSAEVNSLFHPPCQPIKVHRQELQRKQVR